MSEPSDTSVFEEYVRFVQDIIARYRSMGELVSDDGTEVTPSRLNRALAYFYPMASGLNSEYQRAKMDHARAEIAFKRWWDERFLAAKKTVIAEYQDEEIKGAKPSVTEYEARARRDNADDYYPKSENLAALEAKAHFLLRMLEQLSSYDRVLTTLSNNMRSELYSISIDKRTNSDPARNKVRRSD